MEEKASTMEIFFVFDHVPKIFFNESFLIICVDAVHFLPSLHIQYRIIYANVSISVLFFFDDALSIYSNFFIVNSRISNIWNRDISTCFIFLLKQIDSYRFQFVFLINCFHHLSFSYCFFFTFYQSFSFTFHQLPIFRSLFANVFHSNFSIEMCCFLLSIKHLIFRFIEFICILYDIWLLREIPRIV